MIPTQCRLSARVALALAFGLAAPAAAQTWLRVHAGNPQLDDLVNVRSLLEGPNGGGFTIGDYRPTPGGDVVMCGELTDAGRTRAWMARVELATGAVAWSLVSSSDGGRFEAVAPCAAGFVATGSVERGGGDALIVQVDGSGQPLWTRVLGSPVDADRGRRVVETSTGEIAVLASAFGEKLTLFLLDAGGALERTRTYDVVGDQLGFGLTAAPNGDVWIASTYDGSGVFTVQLWAARIDPTGSIVVQNRYLAEGQRALHELVPEPDGGCTMISTALSLSGTRLVQVEIGPDGQAESRARNELASYGVAMIPEAALRDPSGALRIAFHRYGFLVDEASVVLRTTPEGASCVLDSSVGNAATLAATAVVGAPSPVAGDPPSWSANTPMQPTDVDAVATVSCHEDCLGGVESFCIGSPNSTGAVAWMTESGSTSVAQNDLVLRAHNVPAHQTAVFFYGANETQLPMGDGLRCVAHPIFRLPVTQADGAGPAWHALDIHANTNPAGQITSGSTWLFQCWYRDPAAGGAGHNLSLGRRIQFCP